MPDLFKLYSNYLDPTWKTADVLLHTEAIMHGAVRQLNSTAKPPVLFVTRVNEHLLKVDYFSRCRMGNLAVGIIKGIAKYYNESENIIVTALTNPEDEKVEINVEFKSL